MKKNLILFIGLMLLMSVSLVSCGDPNNAPKAPINFGKEWKIMKSYTSDNYQEGDSVVFRRENGALDTFVVVSSGATVWVSAVDSGDDVSEEEEESNSIIIPDTITLNAYVQMKSSEFTIKATLSHTHGYEYASSMYAIYPTNGGYTALWTDVDMEKIPTDYVFENSYGSCHLRRGEGVIDFSDTEGHTWTLVEKLKIQL